MLFVTTSHFSSNDFLQLMTIAFIRSKVCSTDVGTIFRAGAFRGRQYAHAVATSHWGLQRPGNQRLPALELRHGARRHGLGRRFCASGGQGENDPRPPPPPDSPSPPSPLSSGIALVRGTKSKSVEDSTSARSKVVCLV